nr:MAG TPA: YopX protein [Caudoviricetes sp.]
MKIKYIKFKAKRLDNGEWVKGSFVVMKIPALSKTTLGIVAEGSATLHEVDPLTVCQFTGMKDCEGNEIWEGDIVEREIYDLFKGSSKVKAVIEYMDGAFVAITDGIPYSLYFKYIKVIGNKFDKEK